MKSNRRTPTERVSIRTRCSHLLTPEETFMRNNPEMRELMQQVNRSRTQWVQQAT